MTLLRKYASFVTVDDIKKFPVWKYTGKYEQDADETVVEPVPLLPVPDLDNCIVGTELEFKNGDRHWGMIGNINLKNSFCTKQFLTISVFYNGGVFHLARYFDVDYERRSPVQLASALGMELESIFPISFDISNIAIGGAEVLRMKVRAEPEKRLSDEELMRLALQ